MRLMANDAGWFGFALALLTKAHTMKAQATKKHNPVSSLSGAKVSKFLLSAFMFYRCFAITRSYQVSYYSANTAIY